jgi:hypothetical protein
MELALSLEKLNYSKLVHLDKLASEAHDYNLADYVDGMLDGASCVPSLSAVSPWVARRSASVVVFPRSCVAPQC